MTQQSRVSDRLGPLDHHLIGEGSHFHVYRVLGAQAAEESGRQGVRFAVWAPNARRVSVVGDFNAWDTYRHPMRSSDSGVREIFIPDVPALFKAPL